MNVAEAYTKVVDIEPLVSTTNINLFGLTFPQTQEIGEELLMTVSASSLLNIFCKNELEGIGMNWSSLNSYLKLIQYSLIVFPKRSRKKIRLKKISHLKSIVKFTKYGSIS